MTFTEEINTGTTPNDGQGAGLRTNMRILIANDNFLKNLIKFVSGLNPLDAVFNGRHVGIGTATPKVNLSIYGQASEIKAGFKASFLLEGSNPNANYDLANKMVISSSTGYTAGLYIGGYHMTRRHSHHTLSEYGAGIRAIGDSSTLHGNALEFYTSTSGEKNRTRIKVYENGDVGIGIVTQMPKAKLDVNGNVFASGSLEASNGIVLEDTEVPGAKYRLTIANGALVHTLI